jgi:S-adenosylmethionine/arginine decarboxylase-like enzyme
MTILPEFAQELQTHLGNRAVGALFETNRATRYSPQRIQQILKETAEQAQIMQ